MRATRTGRPQSFRDIRKERTMHADHDHEQSF